MSPALSGNAGLPCGRGEGRWVSHPRTPPWGAALSPQHWALCFWHGRGQRGSPLSSTILGLSPFRGDLSTLLTPRLGSRAPGEWVAESDPGDPAGLSPPNSYACAPLSLNSDISHGPASPPPRCHCCQVPGAHMPLTCITCPCPGHLRI